MRRGHLRLVSSPRSDGVPKRQEGQLRVLLVEDHLRVRHGLAAVLNGSPGIEVAEERIDPAVISARIRRWDPDVISLAVQLSGEAGLELMEQLRRDGPGTPIVVLTMQRSPALAQRAVQRGASGVVLKDHADSELVPAVRAAAAGATYISPVIALPDPFDGVRARARGVQPAAWPNGSAPAVTAPDGIGIRAVTVVPLPTPE